MFLIEVIRICHSLYGKKVKRGNCFILQYVNPNYVKNFGHLIKNNQFEVIRKSNFEAFSISIAQNYYESDVAKLQ